MARELTLTQLDRARAARAADRERRPVAQVVADDDPGAAALLANFGLDRSALVGSGGESEVFALDDQRVLRVYRAKHEAPEPTISQLRALYGSWAGVDVGIEVPLILDSGVRDGRAYTIDRRFSGRAFSGWLATVERAERRAALLTFLDATSRVWSSWRSTCWLGRPRGAGIA